ncbi:MAG TPA: hypothetical protein VEX14_03650 [Burkholderiaceae bacterium]|nr:hypothetical protein [Burkholderiaceae bacterium]
MDALVYPRERTLGTITLVLGSIAWLLIVVGTLGIVLIYLLLGFIAYLFAQSGLISYIKNTAVRLTPQQFPDLRARFLDCCKKLQIETPPEAYVLAGNGLLNAQLILIAVSGVLAAVALPAYRDYQQRAQVAEAWLAVDSARNALARFYETKAVHRSHCKRRACRRAWPLAPSSRSTAIP